MSLSVNSFGVERRRERRMAIHLPMSALGTARSGKCFEVVAYTANLSHGGMAITSHIAFDVGSQVELRVLTASTTGNRDNATSTLGRILEVHWDKDIRKFIIRIQYRLKSLRVSRP